MFQNLKKGDYEVNQKVNYCWHKRNAIQKKFLFSIFVTNNINMQKKINFKYRKKTKQQMFCLFLKMKIGLQENLHL